MFSVIKHLIIVTFPLCVCQFLFKDCSMFCFVCYKGFGSWKCFCEGGKTTQSVFYLHCVKCLATFMVVKRRCTELNSTTHEAK